MLGLLTGMKRTLSHVFMRKSVTRKYPYEKRELPERSRGLIALLRTTRSRARRARSGST